MNFEDREILLKKREVELQKLRKQYDSLLQSHHRDMWYREEILRREFVKDMLIMEQRINVQKTHFMEKRLRYRKMISHRDREISRLIKSWARIGRDSVLKQKRLRDELTQAQNVLHSLQERLSVFMGKCKYNNLTFTFRLPLQFFLF